MNHEADAWVGQPRRRRRPATREAQPNSRIIDIQYPILSESSLLHRWNLSRTTLQRWSAKGIGPPAWRIGKHPRYLACEVDWFERYAPIRRPSDEADPLSELPPKAREEAIEQAASRLTRSIEKRLFTEHEISQVTGLPSYWFKHRSEREALDVPHYVLGGGKLIRFDVAEILRWEIARLTPRQQANQVWQTPMRKETSAMRSN